MAFPLCADRLGAYLPAAHSAFMKKSSVLIVSDIQLGKSATFRSRGIPVPEGDSQADLENLTQIIKQKNYRLVHAKDGMSTHVLDIFREWIKSIRIPIILTEENLDRMAILSDPPLRAAFCCPVIPAHIPSYLPVLIWQ